MAVYIFLPPQQKYIIILSALPRLCGEPFFCFVAFNGEDGVQKAFGGIIRHSADIPFVMDLVYHSSMAKRFVLICFLLLLPGVSFAQPAISFRSLTYDFGVLSQKDEVEHVFEFLNEGDRELVIEKLAPS
jgi:hypothetical protein